MALYFCKLLLDEYKVDATQFVEDITAMMIPKEKLANDMTFVPEIPTESIVELGSKKALPQPCFASAETFDALISEFELKEQFESVSKLLFDNVELAREVFLAKGDEMLSERFTYLEKQFKYHPVGTAAFVRETKLTEYCILIPGYIVLDSKTRDDSCTDLVRIEQLQVEVREEITVKKVAGMLGEGVVKGIGGQIGALIFNGIFNNSMKNFAPEDVAAMLKKIVDQELTQETIDQLNGQISGLETWVRNTYTALKADPDWDAEALTGELSPRVGDLSIEVIGVLQYDRYQKPGFCVFMIGAGMHLALLQELAYEDFHEDNPPTGSAYLDAVKKNAKDYADYATSVFNSIKVDRKKMVRDHRDNDHIEDFQGMHVRYMKWVDDYDGYTSKEYSTVWNWKWDIIDDDSAAYEKDKTAYIDSGVADMTEQMSNPSATIQQWLKLVDNPLPSV